MGVILFCMITGELPFNGKSVQDTKDMVISENYIIPPEIEKQISKEVVFSIIGL